MDKNIELATNNDVAGENVVNDQANLPKQKGSKVLTFSMIGAALLAAGAGYFYMTNNSQPAKTVAPVRTHVSASSTVKGKLKNLGVHFDKNHLKVVNTSKDNLTIYVNENKLTLKHNQYADFEIKPKTGQIFVSDKTTKIAFNYELSESNEILSTKTIAFMPQNIGLKNVSVKDIPSDSKVSSASKSSNTPESADFCDKVDINDNTDQMRETFKSIAHNLNLGPLEMLLGPAMPRIVQNSQKISSGSDYINYVTTEDGNGTLGEYLPDILQKDSMNLGAMSLNMKKAMDDSSLTKIIINKNTTAIYPNSVDAAKAKKLIGCF